MPNRPAISSFSHLPSLRNPFIKRTMATIRSPSPLSQSHTHKTALLFPGQGVQRIGMTLPWLNLFPRTVLPLLSELDSACSFPLSHLITSGTSEELCKTSNAQPAIMATSIIILRVLEQEFNFNSSELIDVSLGHSLGEFAALVASGNLNFSDAIQLVRKRGLEMERCTRLSPEREQAGMVALIMDGQDIASRDGVIDAINKWKNCEDLTTVFEDGRIEYELMTDAELSMEIHRREQVIIANINSRNQIVLSGSLRRIRELITHLREFSGKDPRAVRLKVDSPFHNPIMTPAAEMMKKLLRSKSQVEKSRDVVRWPARFPVVSNVSARPFSSKAEMEDLVAVSCVEKVLWHDSIQYLRDQVGINRWIAIGPGQVGRNLVGKEVGMSSGSVYGISRPSDIEPFIKALDNRPVYQDLYIKGQGEQRIEMVMNRDEMIKC